MRASGVLRDWFPNILLDGISFNKSFECFRLTELRIEVEFFKNSGRFLGTALSLQRSFVSLLRIRQHRSMQIVKDSVNEIFVLSNASDLRV